MYNIVYSELARADLDEVYTYLNEKASSETAYTYVNELLDTIEKLAGFPDMGVQPRYPEIPGKVLIHGKYLIFYRMDEENRRIEVSRILHGARDYINEIKN